MKNRKCYTALFFLLLPWFCVYGQSADEPEQQSLKSALTQVEEQFNVTITYADSLVSDLQIINADWQDENSPEKRLIDLLVPHHLMFEKNGEGSYCITSFDTDRRTVREGRSQLEYLSHFYHDKESWENRKSHLRECIFNELKLLPLPHKPDSGPIVTNKRTRDGYTVENVAIETLPGLFVTGSLYRPLNIESKIPVVISPNGHFDNGRYRPDQQYRMAALARMGAISFSYDLFGWGESEIQVGSKAHRTPLAMSIQILNGMRIVDFLSGLEAADIERIGITGGSGGGSQTMLLTALDKRIDVSVPVVMLSSYFNGGCPCESGRPVHLCGGGTNNVEIAAMAAPRPQLVISDGNDWTADVPEVSFPYLQKIYGYYGKKSMIGNEHFPTEGHDYGFSKREVMYRFMARHLELNIENITDSEGNINESGILIEDESELYVFGIEGSQLPNQAVRSVEPLQTFFEENRNE